MPPLSRMPRVPCFARLPRSLIKPIGIFPYYFSMLKRCVSRERPSLIRFYTVIFIYRHSLIWLFYINVARLKSIPPCSPSSFAFTVYTRSIRDSSPTESSEIFFSIYLSGYSSSLASPVLAAPFLNLSIRSLILFGSPLGSPLECDRSSNIFLLLPFRSFMTIRVSVLCYSLSTSLLLSLSLRSFGLSIPADPFALFCSRLMPRSLGLSPSHRLSPLPNDPAEPRRWRHGKKAALKELHIFYALTATWVVQNGRQ